MFKASSMGGYFPSVKRYYPLKALLDESTDRVLLACLREDNTVSLETLNLTATFIAVHGVFVAVLSFGTLRDPYLLAPSSCRAIRF